MTAHSSLPSELDLSGFTVSQALRQGVSRSRLRARELGSPFTAVRAASDRQLDTEAQCRLLLLRLGDGVFVSHSTAAHLWRFHLDRGPADRFDLSVLAPRRAPHAHRIRGHALRLRPGELTRRFGLPITSPIRTWLDLASAGASVDDLVVAGDRLIAARAPLAQRHDLADAIERWRGRGIRNARAAFAELNPASDSGRETKVRRAIVAQGLPLPVAQFPIHDASGRLIGTSDLAFPDYRTLLEYEGDHHRTDRAQWAHDLQRFNRYQSEGWAAYRIDASSFAAIDTTLDLVETSLRARGWRPS